MVRPSILFLLVASLAITADAYSRSPAARVAGADSLDVPLEMVQPVVKSPPWAAVRSAILPGWGQFYTENYFKSILFAGAQVGLFSLWWTEKRAADRDLDTYHITEDTRFENSSISHRNRASNYFSWGLVVSLASVLDAYIDAHLYRFEEKVRMDDDGRVEVSVRLY